VAGQFGILTTPSLVDLRNNADVLMGERAEEDVKKLLGRATP
jgi:hypothetical protein